MTYRVDTLPGSAGAPCLTRDLRLVAMHHATHQNGVKEGIPISAVAAHLRRHGHVAALGG